MDPTDWLPTYPDRPARRRAPIADALASQPPYNPAIFPVADILASLTFLPSYPDRVPHLRETREQMIVTTAAILATAVAPLQWLPIYPPWGPRRRLPLGSLPAYMAPPLGEAMVIAQSLAWQAHWPDRVPHRRPPVPGGLTTWAVTPLVAASTVLVVDVLPTGLQSSATAVEGSEESTVAGEGVGTSTLIHEDLT